jgi:diguanylate cyclase (GGDEF)-like protein
MDEPSKVLLMSSPEANLTGPAGVHDPETAARLKVVVVEDDPLWRLLVTQGLSDYGCEVIERPDALDIVATVQLHRPSAVLIDARLPDVDGFSACRALRQDPQCSATPALMLTCLEDDASVQQAFDAGFDDFFVKSNRWSLLVQRIRSIMRLRAVSGQLTVRQAQLEQAQSAGQVAALDLDLETQQIHGVPGSFSVFGFAHDVTEVAAARLMELFEADAQARMNTWVRTLISNGEAFEATERVRVADGSLRTLNCKAMVLQRAGSRVLRVRGIVRDVSSEQIAAAEIRRLANFDSLTGLVNRNQFLLQAAALAVDGTHPFAIVAIDLDRFGLINAEFGQVAGDDLLIQLTRRWRDCLDLELPGSDLYDAKAAGLTSPLLARLAGDDFALLIPDLSAHDAVNAMIERCQRAFTHPFEIGSEQVVVSASYGVAVFPNDGDSAGLLLSRADVAIASQKALGRSGVHWYSRVQDQPSRVRLEMATALRRALDEQQLELFYQPVVDVRRNRVVGAEALMRWRRDGELVSPAHFIPLAEQVGLIIPMGEWAIGQAAWQLNRWRSSGLHLQSVAVNAPSEHFEHPALARTVRAAMESYGLRPGDIELELTETNLVRDIERIRPQLDALSALGVTLSLDDFGTGYSSLAYLARLPLGKLKVDRSFVSQLGTSTQADSVVRAIISLGSALGLNVVAEGVETPAQVTMLSSLGCHLMQGFFFARPAPADDLPDVVLRIESQRLMPNNSRVVL